MKFAIILLVGLVAFVGSRIRKRTREMELLLLLVHRYDLLLVPNSFFTPSTAQGVIDGFRLELDAPRLNEGSQVSFWGFQVPKKKGGWAISIRLDGGGLGRIADLGFSAEGPTTSVGKIFGLQDHEVGDAPFDREVLLKAASQTDALALMCQPVRKAVRRAVRLGARLQNGRLLITAQGPMSMPNTMRVEHTAVCVDALLNVARSLREAAADPAVTLAKMARKDPDPEVRKQALQLLVKEHGDRAETTQTLEMLVQGRDTGLRLQAARLSKPARRDVFLSVAQLESAPTELRAEALRHLTAAWPPPLEEAEVTVLLEFLGREEGEVLTATLQALLRDGHTPEAQSLKACVRRADEEGSRTLVRLMAKHGPEEEGWLITMLDHPSPPVCVAAAQALTSVGGSSALPALVDRSKGMSYPADLKAAARAAVERIRNRVGATGGRLTLAEESEGRLSVAPGVEGALSVTGAPPPKEKA